MRLMPFFFVIVLFGVSFSAHSGTVIGSYPSTVNNVAIAPDNGCIDDTAAGLGQGGISNQITIPAGDVGTIEDVNVQFQATHTWRSDIQMALSDGTTTVLLANNHDGSGDNYFATFDSQAAELCSAAANCGTAANCVAAPGPDCQSDASLDAFNGVEAAGRTFTLSICDRAAGDNGELLNWTLEVERTPGPPVVTETYPSTDNNVPILPDNGCVDDATGTGLGGISNVITIPAGDTGAILDVDIELQVTHTWRSDLQMALTDGTNTVILANNHDGSGDNYFATFDSQGAELCSAAANCGTAANCVAAPGPICQPNQSLDIFNGAEAGGRTFTLNICDRAGGDVGDLVSWNLIVDREGALPVDADLSVTLVDAPDPVTAGESLTYTVTATNNGPDDAENVAIELPLPAGTSFVSADGGVGAVCNAASPVGCTWAGTTASGESRIAVIVASVDPDTTGNLNATATTTSDTNDPDLVNNTADATTGVESEADLSMTKVATTVPNPLLIGSVIEYTLSASNSGPSDATAVSVSDSLPANLSYVGNDCGAMFAAPLLTWNIGTLAAGASADCVLEVSVSDFGEISNSASIASTTFDPNGGNDTSTEVLAGVASPADVEIALTANADSTLMVGDSFVYTVMATNNGPGTAENLDFLLELSNLVSFVSSNCGAVATGTSVTWTVATLANGASTSCEVTVEVVNAGSISSTASVVTSSDDPVAGNNAASIVFGTAALPVPLMGPLGLLLMLLALGGTALLRTRKTA